MQDDVTALWLRVPRREIAYVKFVFESYEGVAVCRTIDPDEAVVVVIAVPDFAEQARQVVAALAAEGACALVPPPADGAGDLLGPVE
jgi:hypothetical protein